MVVIKNLEDGETIKINDSIEDPDSETMNVMGKSVLLINTNDDDEDDDSVSDDSDEDIDEGKEGLTNWVSDSSVSDEDEHEVEHTSSMEDESHDEEETIKPGMDIVKGVLKKAAREAKNNKSIEVEKHLNVEYDLGTLLATDTNEIDYEFLRDSKEEYLKELARDNTQLLINHIWALPITRDGTEIVAKLPSPVYKLPREKPIPQPKPLTKWEKFAQDKGLRKTKKPRAQWDETLQKWIPWWGYKRVKAEKERDWLVEVRKNDDPTEDPFAKRNAQKKNRVAKNEYQRLRNVATGKNVEIPRTDQALFKGEGKKQKRGKNIQRTVKEPLKRKKEQIPRMGLLTADRMSSAQMKQAITISRASTASLGKFQSRLPKEKVARNVNSLLPMARKRHAPHLNSKQEKEANINIIDGILKKKPRLDVDKAVNRHIHQEQQQRAEEKKSQKPKGKGRGKRSGGKQRGGKGNAKGKDKGKGQGQGKVRMGGKATVHKGGAKGRSAGGKKR